MRNAILVMLSTMALFAAADFAVAKQKPVERRTCPKITHYFSLFTTYTDVCPFEEGDVNWMRGSRDTPHLMHGKPSPI